MARYKNIKKGSYRSKFESSVATDLRQRKIKFHYEPCIVSYQLECHYTPDILLPNGVYIECKGLFDAQDRRKILAVIKCNPDLDLRLLFQNAKVKITKKSKTTYGAWATKHDITWAEGRIPQSWLEW